MSHRHHNATRIRAVAAALALGLAVAGCGASAPTHAGGTSATKTKSHRTNAGGAAGGTSAAAPHTLSIYSSLQLQGPNQSKDDSVNDAMQLALEQARGRVAGYAIRLVEMDDTIAATGAFDPATVKQNARQAIDDPSTIAYIGEDVSGATEISIPIINQAGILQMAPESTDTGLTTGGVGPEALSALYPTGKRTFARVIPNNLVQAEAQASYQSTQGCLKTYVVTDGGTFGLNIAAGVKQDDSKANVSIVGTMEITPTQKDFGKVVAAATAAGANCIFYGGGLDANTVALWDALGSMASQPKLFGANGLAAETFADAISPQSQARTYLTSPGLGQSALNDLGQTFYSEYEARFGGFPDPLAIFGYETMELILSSIRDAAGSGGVTRAAVIKDVFATRNRNSVLGTYSIQPDGDTTLTQYGAYQIQQGALIFTHLLQPIATL